MIKETLIAVTLAVITITVGVIVSHYLRLKIKERKKIRDGQKDKPETKPDHKTGGKPGDWGYDKDAYCYPSINDVMGYEFVKVVRIGEVKPFEPIVVKDTPETAKPNGMTTVSVAAEPENKIEEQYEPDYPDDEIYETGDEETLTESQKEEIRNYEWPYEPDNDIEMSETLGKDWSENENSYEKNDEEINKMLDLPDIEVTPLENQDFPDTSDGPTMAETAEEIAAIRRTEEILKKRKVGTDSDVQEIITEIENFEETQTKDDDEET